MYMIFLGCAGGGRNPEHRNIYKFQSFLSVFR